MALSITKRRVEIVKRLSEGLTYRQIALDLGISHKTVSVTVQTINRIVGSTTILELVTAFYVEGLLIPPHLSNINPAWPQALTWDAKEHLASMNEGERGESYE